MQISGGYINVIDPISKKRIVDPVKNTICGHTYDRDSITGILKMNKKTRYIFYMENSVLRNDINYIVFIFAGVLL